MAALSLAEEGIAANNKKNPLGQSVRAEHLLPKGSVAYGGAQQIHAQSKELDDSE